MAANYFDMRLSYNPSVAHCLWAQTLETGFLDLNLSFSF